MPKIRNLLLAVLFCTLVTIPIPAQSAQDSLPQPSTWTITNAVHFALTNSPDTAMIKHRITAAEAAVVEANAAFYPQFDINASYGRTNNPMHSFGNILNQGVFNQSIDFNNPGTSDNLSMSAMLTYRLYNGGKDAAGLRAAEAGKNATRFQLEAIHTQLGFAVVKTFFTIIQAEENLQARQSAADAITASVSVARARYDAGDLLKADLLSLEVHQSEANEDLIQAGHALNLAKRALLNLLGLKQGDISIDLNCSMEQPLPHDNTFTQRAELKVLDASIQAAEEKVDKAYGGYYPTADAFAGYTVDRGYELDGSGNSWVGGIKVNFNLFAGKRNSARIAQAKASLAEKKEERRKMYLAINLETEQAALGLEQARQRLQVTEKMVEQAEESAHLSRERFKEGVILPSELINVENRLTGAHVRMTAARAAYRIAVADLRRAYGLKQFDTADQ